MYGLWIGLNDQQNESIFTWSDGSTGEIYTLHTCIENILSIIQSSLMSVRPSLKISVTTELIGFYS